MIRLIRSAKIKNGATALAAVGWAKEIASFVTKYDGVDNVEVYIGIGGPGGMLYWTADYTDMATLEKVNDQVLADPTYWKATERAVELFIEGSIHDDILKSL